MPMKRERYPADWEAISQRIRFERAGGMCEHTMSDGSRCNAPHGEWIARRRDDAEQWALADDVHTTDNDYYDGPYRDAVKVCLTVAHLDHDTTNNADTNLAAWCQLHHLRYDAKHHAKNSAETRRQKRGIDSMFDVAPAAPEGSDL